MRPFLFLVVGLLAAAASQAQQVFDLWPGMPPGSESWTWSEQLDSSRPGDPLAYNIVKPTLTYYPVKGAKTAVIICPGGSFCYLHVETEGRAVAQWLNKRGVAAFVLKYRVIHSVTNDPMKEKTTHSKEDAAALAPLAMADVRQAITIVRTRASKLNLDTGRIGIMGFSAGGALAVASAFGYDAGNRPDFVAPIYPYIPPTMDLKTRADAPPLFIAAATDDDYHLVPMSIRLYDAYLESGHSAELHIYSKGGHGFGMNIQHQPSDTWIDRFGDWLQTQGF